MWFDLPGRDPIERPLVPGREGTQTRLFSVYREEKLIRSSPLASEGALFCDVCELQGKRPKLETKREGLCPRGISEVGSSS